MLSLGSARGGVCVESEASPRSNARRSVFFGAMDSSLGGREVGICVVFFYIIGLSQVSVFGRPDYAVFVLCFFGFVRGWCCGLSAAGTKAGSTRPTPPREQTTNFDADDMSFVCQLSKADGAVYKCFPIFVFIPVRRWIHPLRFQIFFFRCFWLPRKIR